MKATASCLCQGIQCTFQCDVSSPNAHCHCRDCQKFHGAAFSTFVEATSVKWTIGQDLLTSFRAENGSLRQFCRVCGASLTFQASQAGSLVEVALAAVDEPLSGWQPDAHVFYGSRVSWLHPGLFDLPKFRRGRDSEEGSDSKA